MFSKQTKNSSFVSIYVYIYIKKNRIYDRGTNNINSSKKFFFTLNITITIKIFKIYDRNHHQVIE